jgi:hypothetical protein
VDIQEFGSPACLREGIGTVFVHHILSSNMQISLAIKWFPESWSALWTIHQETEVIQ